MSGVATEGKSLYKTQPGQRTNMPTFVVITFLAVWADHPNIAKALKNPDTFEEFIAKAMKESPEYTQEFEAMIAEAEELSAISFPESVKQVSIVASELQQEQQEEASAAVVEAVEKEDAALTEI